MDLVKVRSWPLRIEFLHRVLEFGICVSSQSPRIQVLTMATLFYSLGSGQPFLVRSLRAVDKNSCINIMIDYILDLFSEVSGLENLERFDSSPVTEVRARLGRVRQHRVCR